MYNIFFLILYVKYNFVANKFKEQTRIFLEYTVSPKYT